MISTVKEAEKHWGAHQGFISAKKKEIDVLVADDGFPGVYAALA